MQLIQQTKLITRIFFLEKIGNFVLSTKAEQNSRRNIKQSIKDEQKLDPPLQVRLCILESKLKSLKFQKYNKSIQTNFLKSKE